MRFEVKRFEEEQEEVRRFFLTQDGNVIVLCVEFPGALYHILRISEGGLRLVGSMEARNAGFAVDEHGQIKVLN